jgi:hypothetical protein
MPVISMGLPSGFVPKAPLFVPVIRNVAATRDPSRFSKESTISESKFPMAALKSSARGPVPASAGPFGCLSVRGGTRLYAYVVLSVTTKFAAVGQRGR